MIARILYTKGSPSERAVQAFAQNLDQLGVAQALVEADSVEGIALNELYDLPSRPAVILTSDDGTMIERWQNGLPLASEVSHRYHV